MADKKSRPTQLRSLRRLLRVRPLDTVSNAEVRRRCQVQSIPQLPQTRRLRWFGHASYRNPGIFIREPISPLPLPGWCMRLGGQLRTWLGTIKADAEVISGPHSYGVQRWRRDWLQRTQELANDRRAWAATIRDLVNNEADSTPPG